MKIAPWLFRTKEWNVQCQINCKLSRTVEKVNIALGSNLKHMNQKHNTQNSDKHNRHQFSE